MSNINADVIRVEVATEAAIYATIKPKMMAYAIDTQRLIYKMGDGTIRAYPVSTSVPVLSPLTEAQNTLQSIADATALSIRAFAGQTEPLQQWQNSGGTAIAAIDAAGNLVVGAVTAFSIFLASGASIGGVITAASDVKLTSAGKGIYIKEGSNATMGRATLVAGVITISTTKVTALSEIFVQRQVDGGTVAASYSITRSAGASFTLTAKDGAGANQTADTSTVAWWIAEPA